jgi:hypothetical protein
MSKREFRYHSIEPEGLWTSEVFGPADHRHIVQGVTAGWLGGHPRWATDLEGNFIYGLDAKGKEMKSAPKAHATRAKAPSAATLKALDAISYHEHVPAPTRARLVREGYVTADGHITDRGQEVLDRGLAREVMRYGHATKKSPEQLDAEIAEMLGRVSYGDDPAIRAKWQIDPSEVRVGMRFDYFGRPFEIVKIGRDKAKTIQIASRYTKPSGKEDFIDHKSFPLREFYRQHLRPIR